MVIDGLSGGPSQPLRVVVVGAMLHGSRTLQRVRALRDMGHKTYIVSSTPRDAAHEDPIPLIRRIRHHLRFPADPEHANEGLMRAAERGCDVIWIENAPMINARTLEMAKKITSGAKIIWYAEDDMMSRKHGSWQVDRSLGLYDLWVTTKSFNATPDEMPSRGVRHVLFVNNSFDPHVHRRVDIAPEEKSVLGAVVSFIGTYEKPRARSMLFLAQSGIAVRVWGNGWEKFRETHPLLRIERKPVYDGDIARVISSSDINLSFLRKANRDLQTTRSIEIPACGGFMVHERNDEIRGIFAENREAVYFSRDQELVENCRHWLSDDRARRRIAEAGHRKVMEGEFTHADLIARVFKAAMTTPAAPAAS